MFGCASSGTGSVNQNEVDAVVSQIKAQNEDFEEFCRSGDIRSEVTDVVGEMTAAGDIQSNPRAVGQAAGKKISQ
jgi:hypothetical protein